MNPNTCHNGGTCVSLNATDFTCTCDPKYTGITCETGDIPYNYITIYITAKSSGN